MIKIPFIDCYIVSKRGLDEMHEFWAQVIADASHFKEERDRLRATNKALDRRLLTETEGRIRALRIKVHK